MKKLLLLLVIVLLSLPSMAIGFPQNSYKQQKELNKNTHKSEIVGQMQTLEASINQTLNNFDDSEEKAQLSIIEMAANYLFHLFEEIIFVKDTSKDIACKIEQIEVKTLKIEAIAIKNEFEYYLIG